MILNFDKFGFKRIKKDIFSLNKYNVLFVMCKILYMNYKSIFNFNL